jgi:hypothetical protein
MLNDYGRDHKSRMKKAHFEPFANEHEIPPCPNERIDPQQWKELCVYWKLENVMVCSSLIPRCVTMERVTFLQ